MNAKQFAEEIFPYFRLKPDTAVFYTRHLKQAGFIPQGRPHNAPPVSVRDALTIVLAMLSSDAATKAPDVLESVLALPLRQGTFLDVTDRLGEAGDDITILCRRVISGRRLEELSEKINAQNLYRRSFAGVFFDDLLQLIEHGVYLDVSVTSSPAGYTALLKTPGAIEETTIREYGLPLGSHDGLRTTRSLKAGILAIILHDIQGAPESKQAINA